MTLPTLSLPPNIKINSSSSPESDDEDEKMKARGVKTAVTRVTEMQVMKTGRERAEVWRMLDRPSERRKVIDAFPARSTGKKDGNKLRIPAARIHSRLFS